MTKPNIVEVTRYIRPDVHDFEPYRTHSNLYGITVIYEVDYAARLVKARWSMCRGDNFSKKEGIKRARASDKVVVFPLDDKVSLNLGLLTELDTEGLTVQTLWEQNTVNINEYAYEWIEYIFRKSRSEVK